MVVLKTSPTRHLSHLRKVLRLTPNCAANGPSAAANAAWPSAQFARAQASRASCIGPSRWLPRAAGTAASARVRVSRAMLVSMFVELLSMHYVHVITSSYLLHIQLYHILQY
jgi:hypothetical protein